MSYFSQCNRTSATAPRALYNDWLTMAVMYGHEERTASFSASARMWLVGKAWIPSRLALYRKPRVPGCQARGAQSWMAQAREMQGATGKQRVSYRTGLVSTGWAQTYIVKMFWTNLFQQSELTPAQQFTWHGCRAFDPVLIASGSDLLHSPTVPTMTLTGTKWSVFSAWHPGGLVWLSPNSGLLFA